MVSDVMTVTSRGKGMNEALTATERFAIECGLEKRPVLHLRLLAEELFGMLRSIAGDAEADYRIEAEGKKFVLRMHSRVSMTREMRQQFLSVSGSGSNAAAVSFMGKIRDMIANVLLPSDDGPSLLSLGLMSMGSPGGYRAGVYEWDMQEYKKGIAGKAAEKDGEAAEAWDELEKSIVAKIADDVKVGIKGSDVELTVYKSFS